LSVETVAGGVETVAGDVECLSVTGVAEVDVSVGFSEGTGFVCFETE